jgi:hypothetical protein
MCWRGMLCSVVLGSIECVVLLTCCRGGAISPRDLVQYGCVGGGGVGASTIGDGAGACLLEAGDVPSVTLGNFTKSGFAWWAVWKILAGCCTACRCVFPSCGNGVAGIGFCSTWIKSRAAKMALSAEDVVGICDCEGKNSTVCAVT